MHFVGFSTLSSSKTSVSRGMEQEAEAKPMGGPNWPSTNYTGPVFVIREAAGGGQESYDAFIIDGDIRAVNRSATGIPASIRSGTYPMGTLGLSPFISRPSWA